MSYRVLSVKRPVRLIVKFIADKLVLARILQVGSFGLERKV
jgi:hypothetical protein